MEGVGLRVQSQLCAACESAVTMERLRVILTNSLLVFVLVTVGYALGRNSVVGRPTAEGAGMSSVSRLDVYYMHSTFRCETCDTIERLTLETLKSKFPVELKSGQIKWASVDFQEDEVLARRFDVVSSCVVLSLEKDGVLVDSRRLDDVWSLVSKPVEFESYIADAARPFLKRLGDEVAP